MGIPTANIPISGLDIGGYTDIESGVYYGWAGISLVTATEDETKASEPTDGVVHSAPVADDAGTTSAKATVYPMVMSIGWNPYYKNSKRTVEVHIMHKFEKDFYNALMNLSILGFIRPELDYVSKEALIQDIKTDIEVAERSLQRTAYQDLADDPYLYSFEWAGKSDNKL